MLAGHFALAPVLLKYYPGVSPYVLTLGVGFLDVIFGLLTFAGYEGFSPNPHAGFMGVDIHCNYSHSLFGSVLLSAVYGASTGAYLPGFLASFSHFIADIVVHNQDIMLDPFTKVMIGGTNMWANYPSFAFYFELAVCLAAAIASTNDRPTLVANSIILFIHVSSKTTTPDLSRFIQTKDLDVQDLYAGSAIIATFVVPALLLGYILSTRNKNQIKGKQH